ncbi:hypothetical protein HanRHA438_Chr16g0756931 [Helianthus annuus]|nr:hypothetical protein HanRHA438_Chr16g0756931 [Helianthus annuus]
MSQGKCRNLDFGINILQITISDMMMLSFNLKYQKMSFCLLIIKLTLLEPPFLHVQKTGLWWVESVGFLKYD